MSCAVGLGSLLVSITPIAAEDPQLAARLAEALDGGPPVVVRPTDPSTATALDDLLAAHQLDPRTAVVVTTSGSTGRPKAVQLSAAAITAGARATEERIGAGGWALALPAATIAGLMVQARALLAGGRARPIGSDLADPDLVAVGTEHVSVVPTQLHRIRHDPDAIARLAGFATVLVGGGPVDPGLAADLRAAGVRLMTTYGMSETCGGVVYDGRALPGVQIRIDADERVLLDTPTAFLGYLGDPDLTAATLQDGLVRTADRGRLEGDRLRILGRLDQVAISGGVNVDLAQVERVATAALGPTVAIAARPHPEWGEQIVAVTTVGTTLAELRARLAPDLPSAALPRALIRVDSLPRTGNDKIDRARLRSLAAAVRPEEEH